MRQKSIPHDAFIVCSQTRTRPHSDQSYCTQALTKKTTESLLQHLGRSGENAHKINSQCHLEEFCIIADRNELSFSILF